MGGEQDRTHSIYHKEKRVLLVDFSHCSDAEVESLSRSVPSIVTAEPLNSVLILSGFTGASFDQDALRTMKKSAVFDKARVKEVGTS
jgi:hypothetical protein